MLDILNPEALLVPQVLDLIVRAFHGSVFPTVGEVLPFLHEQMQIGGMLFFAVRDEAMQFHGMALVAPPQGPFMKTPHFAHFYARHRPVAKRLILDRVFRWMKENRYPQIGAMNQSGLSDEVYVRQFKRWCAPRFVGSWFVFDSHEEMV